MIRARLAVLFAVAAGVPLAVACSSGPGDTGNADGGPGTGPTTTSTGSSTGGMPTGTATGTTTSYPGCPDPGICGPGLAWNASSCRCEDTTKPPPPPPGCFDAELPSCPPGWTFNPYTCQCFDAGPPPPPPPPQECYIPGYGVCYAGQTCIVSFCPNGGEDSCFCGYNGSVSCSGCGDFDAGYRDAGYPDVTVYPDVFVPPPFDAGASCYVPGYGVCQAGTTCVVGYCPDGKTPVSCYCGDGQLFCNGACQPGYPDGGFD